MMNKGVKRRTFLETVVSPSFISGMGAVLLFDILNDDVCLFSDQAIAQAGGENIQAHTSWGHDPQGESGCMVQGLGSNSHGWETEGMEMRMQERGSRKE